MGRGPRRAPENGAESPACAAATLVVCRCVGARGSSSLAARSRSRDGRRARPQEAGWRVGLGRGAGRRVGHVATTHRRGDRRGRARIGVVPDCPRGRSRAAGCVVHARRSHRGVRAARRHRRHARRESIRARSCLRPRTRARGGRCRDRVGSRRGYRRRRARRSTCGRYGTTDCGCGQRARRRVPASQRGLVARGRASRRSAFGGATRCSTRALAFPARNRIIAAIADVVVVVESRHEGGSMHTVTEAERRGRPVFAAPGPVRSATSAGTNRLLRDGAHVVCDAGDVLVALGLSSALCRPLRDPRPQPSAEDAVVLDAVGWSPASLDGLAARTSCSLGQLALALNRLCEQGWLEERAGWFERVARREP